ncbi:MAG: aminotransferase class V-fold PLP-dependent enzyme [Gammaproteobacteria bacterium]|nr:MAG: aminotransferase class V-fold PLP-dependent enzyme [Gammaproteobacteria bacterium]
MNTPVYLDNAASTPVDPAVAALMQRLLQSPEGTANPSAGHAAGRAAAAVIEQARREVAALIHADPGEIVFTSGATESDNLAIIGAARFRRRFGRHLVTSAIEHPAVLESCRALEAEGFQVSYVAPDDRGRVAAADIAAALRPDTILVSLLHAHNEIGVVQDIAAVGALCRRHGALFHVDAAQSAGRLPLDVRAQCIDLLSLSAHKLHGPKGIGALFLDRERCRRVTPLLHGGGQERGLRPGTLPTHQVAGMGRAFALAAQRLNEDPPRIAGLRDRLWRRLATIPGILLNGPEQGRVCHILNVSIPGVDGESLRLALRELAVAGGSACTAETGEPSPVLRRLGRSEPLALASLRFSIGRQNTEQEIDFAAECVHAAVERLRALAPAEA